MTQTQPPAAQNPSSKRVGRSFPRMSTSPSHNFFTPQHHHHQIMAPIIPTQPSKLFARDIAAYSDAELDRYLETNRG